MLSEYIAAHPLHITPAPQFPPAANRAAWEAVSPADRADLLVLADTWRSRPYPLLTAGMYAAFVRTGSRKDCETPYFARRVKLCAAALHVCLTGTDEDLPIVEDGLLLLCEETAWAISAHLSLTAEHPYPNANQTVIDLFAAQTGMIVSFICQLLEDRLHPDVFARVRQEVARRILSPFMGNDNEWWMGFVRKDLCNWTPWIVSNVMMSANIWHFDCGALYPRACAMLDRWLDCVPEDGGCDEGAAYWNMAGGAFLDCLMLLEETAGLSLWRLPKVRNMMAFPEKMHLGGGWFANFADCDARPYISGERLEYAGVKTGNPALIRMGTAMRGAPSRELADVPHLSPLLMRLFHPAASIDEAAVPAKDVWLPDLQVRILQKGPVTLCAKGGHNGESHNHNDVGNFIVAVNGQMRIVDAGNMVYTAKTFSDRRYELWNCRAAYHNVPLIGAHEQQPGVQYAAREVQHLPDGMALDMAPAYAPEAAVTRAHRQLTLTEDAVTIADAIDLNVSQPITWVFMFREEPAHFTFDPTLTAAVEPIEITDARMRGNYPGALWRLTLTAPAAQRHRQTFIYHTKED